MYIYEYCTGTNEDLSEDCTAVPLHDSQVLFTETGECWSVRTFYIKLSNENEKV